MKFKKILASLIAVSITAASMLSCAGSAFAAGNAQMEYVKSILGKYLSDTEYASLEGVSLSDAFDLYDLETMTICNKNIFVAYHDNTVIGIMCVSLVNGEYCSTFQEFNSVCLQDAFDDGIDIAFCCKDGKALAYIDDTLYDIYTSNVENYTIENDTLISMSTPAISYVELETYAQRNSRSLVMVLQEMDYFKRVLNANIGDGICWCASIAVKYNYKHRLLSDDDDYKSATKVYATIRDSYESGLVTPIGNIQYITRGLSLFGLSDTYCQTSATVTAIFYELYRDNPVLIGVEGEDSNGKTTRHNLIIGKAVYNDDYSAIYTVADSNTSTAILTEVHVGNADSSNCSFYYSMPGSSIVYYDWYNTYSFLESNPHLTPGE